MKKYLSYVSTAREVLQKPCIIEFEGKAYTSFCNGHSIALTTEPCGALELYTDGNYPDVGRLIKRESSPKKIDFSKVFAEAKTKGYKVTKAEVCGGPTKFMMYYDGAYFRLGLFDITYRVIDNGGEVDVYHKEGNNVSSITIENELGICMVLPVRCDAEFIEENQITVINAE